MTPAAGALLPMTRDPKTAAEPRTLRALQIGLGWFGERAGGSERYFADLLAALEQVGVDSAGLVAGSPQVTEMSGGKVSAFAPMAAKTSVRRVAAARAVADRLRSDSFDLVVSHFALYGASALSSLRGRPLVTHFHGPWAAESRAEGERALTIWIKSRIERRVYRRSSRVITLSRAFENVLCRGYGVDEACVRVIPGGVDLTRFRPTLTKAAAREQLGWPADRPIVLAVRRLTERMGLEHLIDAMSAVRESTPDALCLIAGRGRLMDTLTAQIHQRGLSDHVRLLGFVTEDQLPLAYQAADVSVVPSVSLEGFGLVAAESLAAGTPAVVTPVCGLPEVVSTLSRSLVFEQSTTGAIADRLGGIFTGRVTLPDSATCRRYAEEHFDWLDVARRVRGVYEEAIGQA